MGQPDAELRLVTQESALMEPDIAAEWGVNGAEAAQRLQPGSAIYFLMDEDDVQRILAFDETMIGSDGIPVGEKPHPRLWGTFPRVLGHYGRELSLVRTLHICSPAIRISPVSDRADHSSHDQLTSS